MANAQVLGRGLKLVDGNHNEGVESVAVCG